MSAPPLWAAILEAAEEWHIPPWALEKECNAYWWERWMVRRNEQMRLMKKQRGK